MRRVSSPSRRTRLALAGCAAALLVVLAPRAAYAQREAFVDHMIGLYTALGGAFGDEGPRVRERIDGMAAALTVWDTSFRAADAQLRARLEGASAEVQLHTHATLASLYINRSQFREGLRELESAIAIEPQRSTFHLLRGRLLDALGREAEAASAYARAWELAPLDAVPAYLAIARPKSAEPAAELPQVRSLLDAHRRGTRLAAAPDGAPPIVELSLVADGASSRPIFAAALYAEGFHLIAAGRYREAVDRLREVSANDPLVVDPVSRSEPMSTGIALLRDGRLREAIPLLESAAAAHPDSSEVYRILGTVYSAVGDARAITHLRSALRLAPADERAHLALGRELRDAGRLNEAEQALRDAALAVPESGEVQWLLADVIARAGRGLDAARAIETAGSFTMLAGKAALYLRAAELYNRHQDFDRVVSVLSERVRIDPNNAAVHKWLGLAQNRIGREQAALVELVMADLLAGGDAAVLAAIGQNHLAASRFEDAEAVLRRAIAASPDDQQVRYSLGQTLLRLGRTDDAREQFDAFQRLRDHAMEDHRRNFEWDKLRAEAMRLTASGQNEMAAAVLGKLVDLTPEQVELRLGLAEALTQSRHFEDAVPHLEKAAALGAGPDVYRRLAEVYARLGRRELSERANQMYERGLREFLRAPGSC